jgi:hypothetical protein
MNDHSLTDSSAGQAIAPGRANGRRLEFGISLYGGIVFIVLWVGLAIGLASGGAVLDDAWARLTSLPPVLAVVFSVLILPIAIALWAWAADLSPIAGALILLGLVAWTGLAASGLRRTFRRR